MTWLKKQDSILACLGERKVKILSLMTLKIDPYEFIGRHIFIEGIYEEGMTRLFQTLISRGECVLDIGANIGYYSILASRLVGAKGQVIAYEANPQIAEQLRLNAIENSCKNVSIYKVAVSDYCGNVSFFVAGHENKGLSSMRDLGGEAEQKIKLPCITIDSMLARIPKASLVKIDVEGAELLVLKGMKELISRDRPSIVFEATETFFRQMGYGLEDVEDFFRERSYGLYEIRGAGVKSINTIPRNQVHIIAIYTGEKESTHKKCTFAEIAKLTNSSSEKGLS